MWFVRERTRSPVVGETEETVEQKSFLLCSSLGRAYGCLLSSVRTGATLLDQAAGGKVEDAKRERDDKREPAGELEEFNDVVHRL